MKKLISVMLVNLLTAAIFLSCSSNNADKLPAGLVNNPKSASGNVDYGVAVIEFSKMEHDFGRLIQGEKVSYSYKFTNTGKSDLIISKVSASCGCTASKYSKEPIKPGKEGKVEVTFDSNGQRGMVNKTVTVVTNTQPQTTILRLKAQVITPGN